jgi:hypothetical protein
MGSGQLRDLDRSFESWSHRTFTARRARQLQLAVGILIVLSSVIVVFAVIAEGASVANLITLCLLPLGIRLLRRPTARR